MTKLRAFTARTAFLLIGLGAAGAFGAGCEAEPTQTDDAYATELTPELEQAALANLERIAREIDHSHLKNYGKIPATDDPEFEKKVAKLFLESVKKEYAADPELQAARVTTLASMVFFSAPEVETDPELGHVTPFHGMDDQAFEALMTNEDFVFNSHMQANGGSPNGVRPFSVCETKYLIGISKGEVADDSFVSGRTLNNYDAYAQAYKAYAAECEERDLAEWYNFRGLGGLRPSWLESNYNDRVLRAMLKACKSPKEDMKEACDEFQADRLAYRDRKNIGLALREMAYDTSPESTINGMQDGDYMGGPNNPGVFVEDRNGDNVAEWLAPGPVTLIPNASLKLDGAAVTVSEDGSAIVDADGNSLAITSASLEIKKSGQFGGGLLLTVSLDDGSTRTSKVPAGAVSAIERVHPAWQPELAQTPDLGMMTLFADGTGCEGDTAKPETCPLIRRFYSLIDRHENFYQTFSSVNPLSSGASSQPSPLVACSITLRASHHWDTAGTPTGGTAGFIYLMRIPFEQILVGDTRSIDTLGRLEGGLTSGPRVLTLQEIYEEGVSLDMSKVWLDIATLSNNQYSSEHEVSKFGTVPAEQIEGILVIRRPTAMGPAPDNG